MKADDLRPHNAHEHTRPHQDVVVHAVHDMRVGPERHAGPVEMFWRNFWGTLLLSVPRTVWASGTAAGSAYSAAWYASIRRMEKLMIERAAYHLLAKGPQ
jgi:hypothetical protein